MARNRRATKPRDACARAESSLFDLKREWDTLLSAFNKAWDKGEDCDELQTPSAIVLMPSRVRSGRSPSGHSRELALLGDVARERLTRTDDACFAWSSML